MSIVDVEAWGFRSQPWYRKVAMVVLAPFVLLASIPIVLVLFACLFVGAAGSNCIFQLRVWQRMRREGRYLSMDDVRTRIATSGGTLIIDSPSLGWNMTHAWWTPDDVLSASPFSLPTDEEYKNAAQTMNCFDWDKWCWKNYTCLDNGRAFLLRVRNGASIERALKRRFPDLGVVHTWTGLVDFANQEGDANDSEA